MAMRIELIGVFVVLLWWDSVVLQASAASACDDYNCVQGKCVEVDGFPPVKCECNPGWSNVLGMSFLSCVIPKCDFNLKCAKDSKVDNDTPASNSSSGFNIFNPCSYPVCGEGDCIRQKGSDSGYTCSCHQGYANLLNSSTGICIADCSLGAGCDQLGISLGPSSSPSSSDKHNGTATVSDVNGSGVLLFPSVAYLVSWLYFLVLV